MQFTDRDKNTLIHGHRIHTSYQGWNVMVTPLDDNFIVVINVKPNPNNLEEGHIHLGQALLPDFRSIYKFVNDEVGQADLSACDALSILDKHQLTAVTLNALIEFNELNKCQLH